MLDGADLFSHGGSSEQSLSFFFLFGIVFFANEAPMDVVDYGSKGRCSRRDLDGGILGCSPPSFV